MLAFAEKDRIVKEELEKLVEEIHFSDPMNSSELIETEIRIANRFDGLSASADKPADIAAIRQLLKERNLKCIMLRRE